MTDNRPPIGSTVRILDVPWARRHGVVGRTGVVEHYYSYFLDNFDVYLDDADVDDLIAVLVFCSDDVEVLSRPFEFSDSQLSSLIELYGGEM